MQEERVRALALFEKKMEEMSDQINEKSKKIYQLEEEIRTIAYSGQVALPVKIDQVRCFIFLKKSWEKLLIFPLKKEATFLYLEHRVLFGHRIH